MAFPIHVMIRVREEARSVDFYRRALGLEPADRFVFDGFTLVYLRGASSPFEIELTINHDRDAAYELGDGYGHVAVAVEDLAAEHARLSREGFAPTPLRELRHDGHSLAHFCFLTDPDGYRIEVMQREGRYR